MDQSLKEQIYLAEDIHAKLLKTLEADPKILQENKEAVRKYLNNKAAEGITTVRLNIIFAGLLRIVRLSQKSLASFTEQDVRELVGLLERRKLSEWTKNLTKTVFKGMLKSMGKDESLYSWIKSKTPPNKLRSEDLLTEEEMSRMVAATDSIMWKAMLSIMFECGPRPGELLNLRIKDVRRNGVKYKLYVRGKLEKTLGERVIYVYKSLPQLEQWLSVHPAKSSQESPMWLSEDRKIPIGLAVFCIVYQKISHRARIERRNWPYLARHTRLTQMYRDLGSVIGAKLAGHILGSKEIRTYTHLSEADVERALDTANGVKDVAPPEEPLKCPKCQLQNPYGKIFCTTCNTPLGAAGALIQEQEPVAVERSKTLELLAENPKIMELLRKLAEKPWLIEKVI